MENWRSIHDWMRDIASFEDFEEIITPEADHKSDARLIVLSGGMNPNVEIVFKDCWPSAIGPIEFDSAVTDLEAISTEVTFTFDSYSVTKL